MFTGLCASRYIDNMSDISLPPHSLFTPPPNSTSSPSIGSLSFSRQGRSPDLNIQHLSPFIVSCVVFSFHPLPPKHPTSPPPFRFAQTLTSYCFALYKVNSQCRNIFFHGPFLGGQISLLSSPNFLCQPPSPLALSSLTQPRVICRR